MKILIDILHPAHVHVFRNFISLMQQEGHQIFITTRDKDVALPLLDFYNIRYIKISKIGKNKRDLLFELIQRNWRFYKIAKKIKPDVLMGCMGPTISVVGWVLRIPTIVFYNNETATLTNSFTQPLATAFVTSTSYNAPIRGRSIKHNSYHELAYLHPKYFNANPNVLREAGLKKNERFFILRFVSWQSSHDLGVKGISNRISFVKELEKRGKVLISSEAKLPAIFEKNRITLPANKMHDLMAFATLYVGESATMAAEAALLGVPSIYVANTRRGYTDELEEKYGLVYNFENQNLAIKKTRELLKRKKMLQEKIDLTAWMIEFIKKVVNEKKQYGGRK